MAHIYAMSRGIVGMRDEWLAQMRGKFFDFPRYNLNVCECGQQLMGHIKENCNQDNGEFKAKKEMHRVQLALRPIELWEIVLPQEGIPELQTMLHHHSGNEGAWGGGKYKLALASLRKMLGAKKLNPLPSPVDLPKDKHIHAPGFGANIIGIKEDRVEDMPQWGWRQEML